MKKAWLILGLLVLLHVGFAIWYAAVTPYRAAGLVNHQPAKDIGAPDERQHVNYIARLLEGKGFPVFDPNDPNLYEDYQSHQPPLYYLLAAGWARVTGVDDVTSPNAGLRLRMLNAFIGGATVVGVFCLSFWGYRRIDVSLAAAALAALLPMNLALSGAVGNDPLLFCLCTWAIALFTKGFVDGWSLKLAILAGLVLGLTFVTKSGALALVPAILLAFVPVWKDKAAVKAASLALFLAVVVAAPWWWHNQSLYHDPFAIHVFNEAFKASPTRLNLPGPPSWFEYYTNWVGWWTLRSFVGVFGYMDVFLGDTFYRLSIAALGILGLGGFLALGKKEYNPNRVATVLNSSFLALIVLAFIWFNKRYFQGQARYLLPAIGTLANGFGLGLAYFSKDRWKVSLVAWVVVLAATNVYILAFFLQHQFQLRMSLP